jgi:hypothetical protein
VSTKPDQAHCQEVAQCARRQREYRSFHQPCRRGPARLAAERAHRAADRAAARFAFSREAPHRRHRTRWVRRRATRSADEPRARPSWPDEGRAPGPSRDQPVPTSTRSGDSDAGGCSRCQRTHLAEATRDAVERVQEQRTGCRSPSAGSGTAETRKRNWPARSRPIRPTQFRMRSRAEPPLRLYVTRRGRPRYTHSGPMEHPSKDFRSWKRPLTLRNMVAVARPTALRTHTHSLGRATARRKQLPFLRQRNPAGGTTRPFLRQGPRIRRNR